MNRRFAFSTLRSLSLVALLLGGGLIGWGDWFGAVQPARARETPAYAKATTGLSVVAAADLRPQARAMLARIKRGGPFPGYKDGVVFGNYERHLPSKPRGYYREYTVPTPGARNRGARRIVCGGVEHHPEVCYYTNDHYASFRRIVE